MSKKKHEEHENHERWLVSYADFITLLFAFFVVMYSVSAVNEGKFRTVSDSIKAALHPISSPPASSLPFNIGQGKPSLMVPNLPGTKEVAIRRLRELVKTMQAASQFALIHMMEKSDGSIVITIPDQVLFNSGEAAVKPEGLPFLQGLAQAMIELNRQVRVEGHTDNVPIRTVQFPSNWELSATRAVIVVRVLSELYAVPGEHLAALGYADSRPLTANLNPEQRAKNRRVEIIILDDKPHAPKPPLVDPSADAASESDALPAALIPPSGPSAEQFTLSR
jgi:chemotaxis protein MotB